ncbi:MAG: phage major capsid protein [Vicinamibacterales bacterium]
MSGMLTAGDLRAKRAKLHEQGKEILVGAVNRDLTPEERQKYDAIYADIDALAKDVERIERHESTECELADSKAETRERTEHAAHRDPTGQAARALKRDEARTAWFRKGASALTAEERSLLGVRTEQNGQAIDVDLPTQAEKRAAQTVTTTGGGYLIKQDFSGALEESLLAFGGMESVADVFETENGSTLPWPTFNDTAQTGALLAINTTSTEQAITYGVVNFAAYKFQSKYVTVPNELMQDSAFNVDQHVGSVLGTRLGRVHNTYQTVGTGSSEPQGIVAGASSGVTAAGTTTVTYDEILALEHSVDPAYRNPLFGAGFILNDGSLLKLRQIKDGEGRPLWQPGLTIGAPDRINGYPYLINQDMAAMTTGLKPILFGALRKFKIRKVRAVSILRLSEIFGLLDQTAFVGFTRFDSKVLDAGTDPVKYITMA